MFLEFSLEDVKKVVVNLGLILEVYNFKFLVCVILQLFECFWMVFFFVYCNVVSWNKWFFDFIKLRDNDLYIFCDLKFEF